MIAATRGLFDFLRADSLVLERWRIAGVIFQEPRWAREHPAYLISASSSS
jgi:hypothetical protein